MCVKGTCVEVARRRKGSGALVEQLCGSVCWLPYSVMLGSQIALSVGRYLRLVSETCWERKHVLLHEGLALGSCEPLNETSVEIKEEGNRKGRDSFPLLMLVVVDIWSLFVVSVFLFLFSFYALNVGVDCSYRSALTSLPACCSPVLMF